MEFFVFFLIIFLLGYIVYQNIKYENLETRVKNQERDFNSQKYTLDYREQNISKKENELELKQKSLIKKEEDLYAELDKKEKQLYKNLEKVINEKSQTCTWLVNRLVDYQKLLDDEIEKNLRYKSRPAIKASEQISIANKEKRKYMSQAKALQYQLDYLTHVFPNLEDAMQMDGDELEEVISQQNINIENQNYNNTEWEQLDIEHLQRWLSKEEYNNLSIVEKYQLALDRYLRRHKSNWQIGIAYERYIGYKYEMADYEVIYNGALKKFEDMGCDLIAENDKEIRIIQCKCWSKDKVIHENFIFQLYGTMIMKLHELRKNNIQKRVDGYFITTTKLSETAKEVAEDLGIFVTENENFDKTYPCIKCNINKGTNLKIYHLPFDQQYDRIKIRQYRGECYVSTVAEAESLGFRRALKHYY